MRWSLSIWAIHRQEDTISSQITLAQSKIKIIWFAWYQHHSKLCATTSEDSCQRTTTLRRTLIFTLSPACERCPTKNRKGQRDGQIRKEDSINNMPVRSSTHRDIITSVGARRLPLDLRLERSDRALLHGIRVETNRNNGLARSSQDLIEEWYSQQHKDSHGSTA